MYSFFYQRPALFEKLAVFILTRYFFVIGNQVPGKPVHPNGLFRIFSGFQDFNL
jgi:hypothetical protein